MNKADKENNDIECLLKKARPAEPSAQLKARITGAAREAWNEPPAEIPWRIGLRRLAISAAAAVLMISCSNYYSVWSVARWQAGPPVAAKMMPTDFEDMPEVPYGPFVQHLIAVRRSSGRDAAVLLQYMERLQDSVDGAELNDGTDELDTVERRSRLAPVASGIDWHA
jgi:hypothetical protein